MSNTRYPSFSDVVSVIGEVLPTQVSVERYGPLSGKSANTIEKIIISTELRLSISPGLSKKDLILIPYSPQADLWSGIHKQQLSAIKTGVNIFVLPIKGGYLGKRNWNSLGEGLSLEFEKLISPEPIMMNYKLVVFSPPDIVDDLRNALSRVGAGVIGDYSNCSFSTAGVGTFIPGGGAKPHTGEVDNLNEVEEIRLEMVIPQSSLSSAMEVIKDVHPYDEPAFDIYPLHDFNESVSASAKFTIPDWEAFIDAFKREFKGFTGEVEPQHEAMIVLTGDTNQISKAIYEGEGVFILYVRDDIQRIILEGSGVEFWDVGVHIVNRMWLSGVTSVIERSLCGVCPEFEVPEIVMI